MKTQFIHLDTSSSGVAKNNGNPFDCVIPLTEQYRGMKKIYLKSVEIPVSFNFFHSPLNTFTIDSTQFTLPEGNYTSATIITALNAVVGVNGTFSMVSGRYVFTSSSGSRTIFVTTGDVMYALGFTDNPTGTIITATNAYNMSLNTYITMCIRNIGTSSYEASKTSFKIPVNVTNGVIYFYSDNIEFCQHIQVMDPCMIIDRLVIEIRDRFGNILNNNGIDWSMSIACI